MHSRQLLIDWNYIKSSFLIEWSHLKIFFRNAGQFVETERLPLKFEIPFRFSENNEYSAIDSFFLCYLRHTEKNNFTLLISFFFI